MENQNRRRRRKRKPKKRRSPAVRRRRLLFLVIIALIIFGIFQWRRRIPVKSVEVIGAETVDENAIIEASGIKQGDPLYSVSENTVNQRLLHLPGIKNGKVKNSLSGKVVIQVEERRPVAQLESDGEYWVLDDELRLLEKTAEFDPDKVTFSGLRLNKGVAGQYLFLNGKQKEARDFFLWFFTTDLPEKIERVEFYTEGWDFYTADDVKIVFGTSADAIYKGKQLREVLKKMEGMDKKITMVFMERGKDPIAVVEGSGSSPENPSR